MECFLLRHAVQVAVGLLARFPFFFYDSRLGDGFVELADCVSMPVCLSTSLSFLTWNAAWLLLSLNLRGAMTEYQHGTNTPFTHKHDFSLPIVCFYTQPLGAGRDRPERRCCNCARHCVCGHVVECWVVRHDDLRSLHAYADMIYSRICMFLLECSLFFYA